MATNRREYSADDRRDFEVLAWGIFAAKVCAARTLPLAEVTRRLEARYPSGMSGGWRLAEGVELQGGPCEAFPEQNVHYIFEPFMDLTEQVGEVVSARDAIGFLCWLAERARGETDDRRSEACKNAGN